MRSRGSPHVKPSEGRARLSSGQIIRSIRPWTRPGPSSGTASLMRTHTAECSHPLLVRSSGVFCTRPPEAKQAAGARNLTRRARRSTPAADDGKGDRAHRSKSSSASEAGAAHRRAALTGAAVLMGGFIWEPPVRGRGGWPPDGRAEAREARALWRLFVSQGGGNASPCSMLSTRQSRADRRQHVRSATAARTTRLVS